MEWFQDSDSLSFDLWEQKLAEEAVRRTQGDIKTAAVLMGISPASLYRKLKNGSIKLVGLPAEEISIPENAT